MSTLEQTAHEQAGTAPASEAAAAAGVEAAQGAPASALEVGASALSPGVRRLAYVVIALFLLVIVRRAWMSDDAFITLRAVDHLIHGRGFGFNAGERVLGFTNPLWALLLVVPYAVIRDPFIAPVVLGLVVTALFAVTFVFGAGRDVRLSLLILTTLGFSRYFTDFSSGGLENPLTHLLLVLLFVAAFRGPSARLTVYLCAALSFVNRPDSVPLILPPLAFVLWRDRGALDVRQALRGAAPAIAWLAFATFYYGFPLPNTAYAKLNTDIPRGELVRQGWAYLLEAAQNDAALAIIIVLGATCALLELKGALSRERRFAAAALLGSLLLDLVYVVAIGGDFMAGRFLTPSAVVAAIAVSRCAEDWLAAPNGGAWATALTGLVLVTLPFSPWREDRSESKREFPPHRVVDERGWYRENLTLTMNLRPAMWKEYGLFGEGRAARERQERVVQFNNVGMFSWGAGPGVYVLDELALTDPLLARLPFEYRPDWRTGHLPRPIPAGYIETLRDGENVISDPCVHAFYDKLRRVVRGPLFSAARFAAMLELNLPSGATVRPCAAR